MSDEALERELQRHTAWGTRQGSQRGYKVIECHGCKSVLSGNVTDDQALRIGSSASLAHQQRLREAWAREHRQDASDRAAPDSA